MTRPKNIQADPQRTIANAALGLRHVFVRDLLLDAKIGVYAHEKKGAQPIRVNVDLTVAESIHSDDLANVVSYEDVVNEIKSIVSEGHVHLVETLCERIAQSCLDDKRVMAVRVRVEKLSVIEEAASVGVEIERARPGISTL